MATPQDQDLVLSAIRLGWFLAEVRGRNRPNGPAISDASMADRVGGALPLRIERTATELRIEAQTVLCALAIKLGVDSTAGATSFTTTIDEMATRLHRLRKKGDEPGADTVWKTLAAEIFSFDAHVQDSLSARSDTQACGYQLGRGLAEIYWALDPAVADGVKSALAWWFLLGQPRCAELSRLVGRLSAYFNSYTAPAISGCLQVWQAIAADHDWRSDSDATKKLYQQIRRWYELLILGHDPSTLIRPLAFLKGYRGVLRAFRLFWPQVAGAVVSLVALLVAIGLVARGGSTPLGKTLIAAAGVVGLSLTSVSAMLKNSAQALLRRVREDAYTDLVAVAISIVPPPPADQHLPTTTTPTERIVTKTVRKRPLSTGVSV